jgi:hypothetical protein
LVETSGNDHGEEMKKYLFAAELLLLSLIAFAANVEDVGKAWLDAQKDPPAINVNGVWSSEEWGDLHLTQAQGSRDVTGDSGGYELTGVVSAKRLFLLFHTGHGTVDYCATLSPEADNALRGSYSNRVSRLKFGHGLCQDKSRPMHMAKK